MAIAALYGSWRRLIQDRPLVTNNRGNEAPSQPRGRGRRPSRRKWSEKKVDSEFDLVIVPPDGISVSGSESDGADSDWSVGWFEPHSPRFTDGKDEDDTFAVLMPCYGPSSSTPSQHHNQPPLPTPSQHHHHHHR